jgi:hypothetical protein
VSLALFLGERFEYRVTPSASVTGRPVHFSAQESDRCRIESESHQLQRAGTERCVRTPFEVAEVYRIDTGA